MKSKKQILIIIISLFILILLSLLGLYRCPFRYIFENANNRIKVKNEEQLRSLTESTSESKYFKENGKNSFKVICTEFENNLNSQESKIQDKASKAQESLQEKLPDILKRALGFEPFVLNYFRMTYGHLDAFFHYFYEVINNIMSDKAGRTPSKLGLDYDNSDLSKKTDLKNGFVPPFPAVLDKEGKLVYPGSLSNLSDIEEVKLVEKILSAALKAKRKTNEYIIVAANKEETNSAAGTLGFVPSSIFDIFWGTKNPYTMVHNLREAYYLFVLRTMISRLTNEGGGDASRLRPQAIEAYNYYLSNPNPSEDIKAELKKVVNDMKAMRTFGDENIIDVCDYLNLGVNAKGKEGNSKSYVEPIYCVSVQKEKHPVYVYNPAFFYNSIYKQTAGNRLSIDSFLSAITITDFTDYHPAFFYTKIVDHDGNVLLDNTMNTDTRQVMKESTAWLLTSAMEDVILKGTGSRLKFKKINMPQAGKTGTSTGNRDLWFVGYTPYLTAGIWGGYDSGQKQTSLTYQKDLWRDTMEKLNQNYTKVSFKKPDSITTAVICTKCGKLAINGICDKAVGGSCIKKEYFDKESVPKEKCDCHVRCKICKASGHLAGDGCPSSQIYTAVYLQKNESTQTADSSLSIPRYLVGSTCKIHN